MPRASTQDAQKLARLSSDCSFLLTHLIRQKGDPNRTDKEARSILKSILGSGTSDGPILRSSKVGWYSRCKDAHSFDPKRCNMNSPNLQKSVCFTESTLSGLAAHHKVFKAKYGLAFDRDKLFLKGANPCINIRSDLLKAPVEYLHDPSPRRLFNFIPYELHPLVNVINEAFDATHEREWRYIGNLRFSIRDLLFVFCPESDFSRFSHVQKRGRPVLFDLAWLDRV